MLKILYVEYDEQSLTHIMVGGNKNLEFVHFVQIFAPLHVKQLGIFTIAKH